MSLNVIGSLSNTSSALSVVNSGLNKDNPNSELYGILKIATLLLSAILHSSYIL